MNIEINLEDVCLDLLIMCTTNTCGYENMYIVQCTVYTGESELGKVKLKITSLKHKTLICNKVKVTAKAYSVNFLQKLN